MICAVLRLEEHDGRPVVGQILLEGAGCAGGLAGQVVSLRIHGDVEGVSSDDLMKMGSVLLARVDDRVNTVDDELRTSKSKHVLCGSILREERRGGESCPLHVCWKGLGGLDLWTRRRIDLWTAIIGGCSE